MVMFFGDKKLTRGPWAMAHSPEWNSHHRYADVMHHFSNPDIATTERTIILAVLSFEEQCVFHYYVFTVYGHDSQLSMTIWTNSQSHFKSRTDMKFLVETDQVVSEEKLFNTSCMILYIYTAQAQGMITLAEQNFGFNLKLLLLHGLSSHLHQIIKEIMGEEVFQLHVASYEYTSYVSLQDQTRDKFKMVFFPCWCATVSSFPAGVQKGFLALLVFYRVFFPCWCFTNFLLLNVAMATKQNGHWS